MIQSTDYQEQALRARVKKTALAKRCMDLFLVLASLPLLAPILLMISVLVAVSSQGSPFFKQRRTGRDGKPFIMFKFKTMTRDAAPYAPHPIDPDDPRITRLGSFLRQSNLDELPQTINVLKGEMSLVGPRPEMPFITESYSEHERLRLIAVPGITGLWQISEHRGQPIHKHVHHDLEYISTMSPALDMAILIRTFIHMLRGKNRGKA
jgi:lipopolysaccharide/colanic/teichoic acid biosynthesis glycosyltransferase